MTGSWCSDLQNDPEYRRWGQQLKQSLLENGDMQDYLYGLWTDLVTGLESDLENPDSQLRRQLDDLLAGLAEELESDPAMQAWVNDWLIESAVSIVDENRHSNQWHVGWRTGRAGDPRRQAYVMGSKRFSRRFLRTSFGFQTLPFIAI